MNMLSISHAATGAFIAAKISNPYLAIPLIIATHYLQDAVPHWDVGTGLSKGTKTRTQAFIHEIPDLALALVIVYLMYPAIFNIQYSLFHFSPLWGSFFGLLPDFLEAPRNFLGYEPRWLTGINRFHARFHHSIPRPLAGLAPQLILLALLFFYR